MGKKERVVKSRPGWRKATQVQRIKIIMTVVAVAVSVSLAAGALLAWVQIADPFAPPPVSSVPPAPPVSSGPKELPVFGNDYYLLVVNSSNALPLGYTADLTLEKVGGVQVDSRIAPYLQDLLDAAEKGGMALKLAQGYVSAEEQGELYRAGVDKLINEQGYTKVRAEDKMQTDFGKANNNENQTGMAVEFTVDEGSFDQSEESAWLVKYAADYGFVLRYPSNKTNVTGRAYSAAHYRFVGVENARKMRQYAMCLEEYADYVAKQG